MWIVSKAYDLLFFHVSALSSLIVVALFYALRATDDPAATTSLALSFYFIFAMLFDLPHIFQTFSRTHSDKEEFERHRYTHTFGLVAMILGSLAFVYAGWFRAWIELFAAYGYYHILKQNLGFILAYKAKGKEWSRFDYLLDKWGYFFLFLVTGLPYFYARPDEFVFLRFDLIPAPLVTIFYISAAFVFMAFIGRQIQHYFQKGNINGQKISVYLLTLGVNLIIHQDPTLPLVLIVVLETIYHDIQYQGWMIHYQRKTFDQEQVVGKWLMASFGYGMIGAVLMSYWPIQQIPVEYVVVGIQAVTLYHYYVDGKIWKLRQDTTLREKLL